MSVTCLSQQCAAQAEQGSVQEIKRINGLSSSRLRVGMRLALNGSISSRKTVSSPGASSQSVYVVRTGDSMWKISQRFNVPLNNLLAANGLNKKSRIQPGQRLNIPGGISTTTNQKSTVHIVRRGDTLYALAKRYRTDISIIKKANSMGDNVLHPGEQLIIPQ